MQLLFNKTRDEILAKVDNVPKAYKIEIKINKLCNLNESFLITKINGISINAYVQLKKTIGKKLCDYRLK